MTALTDYVNFEKRGRIGMIVVDYPPVNALSHAVRLGIQKGIEAAAADDAVKAVVLLCKGRTFFAGADITEFGKPMKDPGLREVLETVEGSTKPVVAALHGTALGGGLETALACHYRVCNPTARVGLPEVKLGILPGAGGTQRLPRVVGVERALKMIVSGDPILAKDGLSDGLVDEVVEGDLTEGAIAFAEKIVDEGRPAVKISERDEKVAAARGKPEIFENFRKSIARKSRGFEAPENCIKTVEAAVNMPFAEGMAEERRLFEELYVGQQSAAQRYFFFAERQAAKIPDVPADTKRRPIASAGIIGAGTMGGGIAMNFANVGIPVTLVEATQEALDRGIAVIAKNYATSVSRGSIDQATMDKRMAQISGTTDYAVLADKDIVIEAVFEEMGLKKEIFGKLDKVCKKGAILASNTSTLDVDEIAASTSRPEDVIGLHFFSPANVMRLLEIVRGKKTAKDVIATSMDLAKAIRKVGVLVGVCDGFVGNRMLAARGREAEALVLEGAMPEDVDRVIFDFGFPMGPFAMADLAGLDVGWRIRQGKGMTSEVPDSLCELGRFGQKTGAGYYKYEGRNAVPDQVTRDIVLKASKNAGIERRSIDDQEILERCLFPMVNEGAKILEEGLAIRPSDIDVVWVYGYGWPVYRGGPMFWADSIGLDKVVERMRSFRDQFGDQWEPAPLLERLASEGKGFKDYKG
ncbi:3-hydroxyacyl-CoA dehydrogenase NAD-binding domain-containing protein [Oceanibacterium hippocampi]|uniref:Fatty acid oxidation complex subunit alpha n=1 Tax=Oceanibacterium hippocampi TaxID=745714 RepID=A0A1Y5TDE0_9PROT|nr:3-hydroxyacyl-CoA dehydrogenase NAD-binding domain-containing protein [Oceanibacterium hippocampi]SLN57866.1 Fatty acid oxidation complex subunit alpha [Oceanibacterium hippocampi]